MRGKFPDVIAAVLMPNHLHLLLPEGTDPNSAHHDLKILVQRSVFEWEPVPYPEKIRDPKHGRRQIRYIALNPCRSKLCRDPLEWAWSTYRGSFGAVADPWVSAKVLAKAYEWKSIPQFLSWFHSYVSSDLTVSPSGTPVLSANTVSENRSYLGYHFDYILRAVFAASESTYADIARDKSRIRRAVIHLAGKNGWTQTELLAAKLECTPRFVQYCRKQVPDRALIQAAQICLGDMRCISLNAKSEGSRMNLEVLDFAKHEI